MLAPTVCHLYLYHPSDRATRAEPELAFPKELCNPTAAAARLLPLEHSKRKTYKHKEQLGQPKHLCSYV